MVIWHWPTVSAPVAVTSVVQVVGHTKLLAAPLLR